MRSVTLEPRFLDGPRGRLFVVRHAPRANDHGIDVVIAPPFAEEMNRSRRMMALLAIALAERGFGCVAVDPFGTGDSAGDFAEARWDGWVEDMLAAARAGGRRVVVLGLRLGALLAAAMARRGAVERLMLWQPVVNGETFMTQVLRLRLAGDLAQGDGERASTKDLRARLAAGEALEVAGYPLAPDLVAAIDRLRLAVLAPPADVAVDWFEVAADAAQAPGPASRAVIEAWTAAGCAVNATTVPGEPFWTLQETTVAPALVAATVARLTGDAS